MGKGKGKSKSNKSGSSSSSSGGGGSSSSGGGSSSSSSNSKNGIDQLFVEGLTISVNDKCTICNMNTNEPILTYCLHVVCLSCLNAMRHTGRCTNCNIRLVGRDENYGRGLWYDLKSNDGSNKEYVKKAIQFYERAKIAEPKLPFLQYKLGTLYMNSGQFEEARTHFMTSFHQNKRDASSAYSLGMIFKFHDNPHIALRWADAAVNLMSDDLPINMKDDYRELLKSIKSLIADEPPLKFHIGDHVMARTYSGWERGVIEDLWYNEEDWDLDRVSPYQIKLEKGGVLIHAPYDDDSHVKSTFSHLVPCQGIEMPLANYKSMIAKLQSHKVNEKSLIGRKVILR